MKLSKKILTGMLSIAATITVGCSDSTSSSGGPTEVEGYWKRTTGVGSGTTWESYYFDGSDYTYDIAKPNGGLVLTVLEITGSIKENGATITLTPSKCQIISMTTGGLIEKPCADIPNDVTGTSLAEPSEFNYVLEGDSLKLTSEETEYIYVK